MLIFLIEILYPYLLFPPTWVQRTNLSLLKSSLLHVQAVLMFLLSLLGYRLNRSNTLVPSFQIVFQTSFNHQSPLYSYQQIQLFLYEQHPVKFSSWNLTIAVWDGEMMLPVLQTTFLFIHLSVIFLFFCSSMMLLTHVQLMIHSNSQLLFFQNCCLVIHHPTPVQLTVLT